MKGFDIYKQLDDMLDNPEWSKRIKFTYIGNIPKDFKFKNSKHLSAKNGSDLADCIRENDIYLTASINEPGGMHHIEGACCGLPLLYRKSGSLPEYCSGFGVQFNNKDDFKMNLEKLLINYDEYYQKMPEYPNSSSTRISEWVELFETLYIDKINISTKRKLWRNPFLLILNLFF